MFWKQWKWWKKAQNFFSVDELLEAFKDPRILAGRKILIGSYGFIIQGVEFADAFDPPEITFFFSPHQHVINDSVQTMISISWGENGEGHGWLIQGYKIAGDAAIRIADGPHKNIQII